MRIKLLFIQVTCVGLTALIINPASAQIPKLKSLTKQSASVDSFVGQYMNDHHIPGLALAVVQDGQLVKLGTYGRANLETGLRVTDTTIFSIASLTKQFIAMTVLLLDQDGKLSINDPVTKFIDSVPVAWKNITVANLLSHTAGLLRDPVDYHPYREQPVMEVIRSMYGLPLQYQPGDGWLYSNAGYFILAQIIGVVTQQPWDQFITTHLLQPAGLHNTRTGHAATIISNRAAGYHYTQQGLVNAENWISVRPSGAFVSSIQDMVTWDKYLSKKNLLDAAHKRLLWTSASTRNGSYVHYGAGWAVDSFLEHERIHHDGQYPGFRADYERLDQGGLNVIVLANLDNDGLEGFALQVAAKYDALLRVPEFHVRVDDMKAPISSGADFPIELNITSEDKNAPGTVVEIEIRDAEGKEVNKQDRQDVRFVKGDTRNLRFMWKPAKPGTYTLNVGIYAPRWMMSYSWNNSVKTLIVQ